jgi:hypothetical protein
MPPPQKHSQESTRRDTTTKSNAAQICKNSVQILKSGSAKKKEKKLCIVYSYFFSFSRTASRTFFEGVA